MVFGIYERTDGIVYVDLVADASGAELKSTLRENVSIETTVYSDTFRSYRGLDEEFAGHETVSHRAGEYVRGAATINGIEGSGPMPRSDCSAITGWPMITSSCT